MNKYLIAGVFALYFPNIQAKIRSVPFEDIFSKHSINSESPGLLALPEAENRRIDWTQFDKLILKNPGRTLQEVRSLGVNSSLTEADKAESLIVELECATLLYDTDLAMILGKKISDNLAKYSAIQKIRFYGNFGTSLSIIGKSDEGIRLLELGIDLARTTKNMAHLTRRLNDLAWIYLNIAKQELAMKFAVEAELLSRKNRNSYEHAYSLMTVAGVHSAAIRPEQSLELNYESLKLMRNLSLDFSESMVLFNIMNSLNRSKQFNASIAIAKEIIPISEVLDDQSTLSYVYLTLGACYKGLGEKINSIKYYSRTIPFLRSTNDVSALIPVVEALSELYLQINDNEKSKQMIDEFSDAIKKNFQEKIPFEIEKKFLNAKSRYEMAINNNKEAIISQRRLIELMSIQIQESHTKKIESLGSELELEMKKKQYQVLQELSKSQSESIAALTKVRNLFLVTVGLFGLLIFTMYRSYLKNIEIRANKSKIDLILSTISEGIVKFGADFRIAEEHSEYSRQLLNHGKDLTNLNLLEVLRNGVVPAEEIQTVMIESTCSVLWGENELSWELNESNLPKSIRAFDRDLNLSWTPLFDQTELSAIILIIRDDTELVNSQLIHNKSVQQAQELFDKIGRIGEKLPRVLSQSFELHKFIHDQYSKIQDFDSNILPQLHTFKGNCRTLNMSPLHEYIHALESRINEHCNPQDMLEKVQQELDDFLKIATYVGFDKNNSSLNSLLQLLNDNVNQIILRCKENKIALESFVFVIDRNEYSEYYLKHINTFLIHGLNNALDHGFIVANKSGPSDSKIPAQFRVEITENNRAIEMIITDNGKGIDLENLAEICKLKQIFLQPGKPITDILFEEHFSTAKSLSKTSGRGVGLSALRNLAQEFGGEVSIANRIDRTGTILKMTIPIVPSANPVENTLRVS